MNRKWWFVPLTGLTAVLLHRNLRPGAFRHRAATQAAFDLHAGLYEAVFAPVLNGFYRKVAREVAASCSAGTALEVGSGPGRLATRLAQAAPRLTLVGLDISADMVARATTRASMAGLADRVHFEQGDVAALPLPDERVDCAVSTLSLHHWAEPARGLAEIYRVLAPGGEVWVYDFANWFWGAACTRDELARLAAMTTFGSGTIDTFRWPGPLPTFTRLRLRRPGAAG